MAYAIDIADSDSVNLGSNPSPPASQFGLHWRLPDSEKIIPTFRRVGEIRRGLSCGG
jgi:hypothetical protein